MYTCSLCVDLKIRYSPKKNTPYNSFSFEDCGAFNLRRHMKCCFCASSRTLGGRELRDIQSKRRTTTNNNVQKTHPLRLLELRSRRDVFWLDLL
ncbi:hypothetical protein J6590_061897 [Homalodisca vitripennis]|nr:hypothetical protein J6590_061897 [Homalodisca vitripennis]